MIMIMIIMMMRLHPHSYSIGISMRVYIWVYVYHMFMIITIIIIIMLNILIDRSLLFHPFAYILLFFPCFYFIQTHWQRGIINCTSFCRQCLFAFNCLLVYKEIASAEATTMTTQVWFDDYEYYVKNVRVFACINHSLNIRHSREEKKENVLNICNTITFVDVVVLRHSKKWLSYKQSYFFLFFT